MSYLCGDIYDKDGDTWFCTLPVDHKNNQHSGFCLNGGDAYWTDDDPHRRANTQRDALVALLREVADEESNESFFWRASAEGLESYGHHAAAEADRRESDTYRRIAATLRATADEIERGESKPRRTK